jgi:hypothetical protein
MRTHTHTHTHTHVHARPHTSTRVRSYYLTQLELGRHAAYSCCFALEGLTRLARLTLYEDSADVLLPSLSALTQLTHLVLQVRFCACSGGVCAAKSACAVEQGRACPCCTGSGRLRV